ncbi:MAG TPA: hypothetical protein VMF51_08410 [Nocardioides sp.]|uniref:hypothetical protein n=1 Tax=Nocardioides sp. TaxID=35761 RepID=UPI002B9C009B|nr:hypothetical protein [Nocardioides sp.]HTW15138.1 hypothetical protein [Nocardioides sp.]
MAARTPKADQVKVGDTIELGRSNGYVRLPDGTVVTARASYVARHAGEHVVITTDDKGKTTEKTVNVAEVS